MGYKQQHELIEIDYITELFELGLLVLGTLAVFAWAVVLLFGVAPAVTTILGLCCVAVMSFVIIRRKFQNIDFIERDICRILSKQGFGYKKHEGILYVTRNKKTFRIHIADTPSKRVKRLTFVYDFSCPIMDKVSPEGWSRLSNKINGDNPQATFIAFNDCFQCRYETAIANSKEFQKEFDSAFQIIGKALQDFKKLYVYMEEDYPNVFIENRVNIGYK